MDEFNTKNTAHEENAQQNIYPGPDGRYYYGGAPQSNQNIWFANQVQQTQGQANAEQTYQGQSSAGQPYQGQSNAGQPYQGQSYQGQPYTGGSYTYIPYTAAPVKAPKKPKKEHKFLKKAAKLVAAAAVFGIIAGGVFVGTNQLYYVINPNASVQGSSQTSTDGERLNLNPVTDEDKKLSSTVISQNVSTQATDVSAVIESVEPSVVTIDSTFTTQSYFGTYDQTGGGSGIILEQTDDELLIATNNHVVEDATKISVTFIDGSSYEAITKGTDAAADLAVLSINIDDLSEETLAAIKVATLGDSSSMKVGQMAIAIGNALGYGQSSTVGYISAIDREVEVDGNTMVLLQTDAAINPGNSGGALVNINGEVIGINSVKYASYDVEGMGFAIPISRAISILDELKAREILTDEEKGYIGIYPEDVTSQMAAAYNWPVGAYVYRLSEGGAAQAAGIQVGDIITAVNGVSISTGDQLRSYVNSYRAGTVVTVTLQRLINGKFEELNIEVELMSNPDASTDNSRGDGSAQATPTPTPTPEDEGTQQLPNTDDDASSIYDDLPDEIKDFLDQFGF